jgi:hypothetical protein
MALYWGILGALGLAGLGRLLCGQSIPPRSEAPNARPPRPIAYWFRAVDRRGR